MSDSEPEKEQQTHELDIRNAARLRGKWFAKQQLMLPEWMIDIPERLSQDWYVFARPSGKRCFVVSSSNGTTVSRLRNGTMLHRFSSALPYCILDCIFHERDQTYYVIDMVCWGGYSLYECTAEFRFFWLNSKLVESGACKPPSSPYKFSMVSIYNCDQEGLQAAYTGEVVPYVKDGLLFYNKHAHYQMANTPLALVWKDAICSQYVLDTDSKGQVPVQQQVVLELQHDGKLTTSDDPAVVFGSVNNIDFIQKMGLQPGNLLRFSVKNQGLTFAAGKLEKADLGYLGKVNRSRAFADSYSKVMFQYAVRHSPLRIEDLQVCADSSSEQDNSCDMEVIS